MEQPKYTPTCCDLPAKWVQHTVSLAYFYCTVCKLEPKSYEPGAMYNNADQELLELYQGWSPKKP